MYGMPTASVARMPPSTPQSTILPTMPWPKMAVTMSMTAGEIQAVHAAVSTRESRSPTMNSVANTATITPIRMGMPVRGAVVRRHQRSAAARVSWAAAASARASACRALAISRASTSSASVSPSSAPRPMASATSASPSRMVRATPRELSPPGTRRPLLGVLGDVERDLLDALLDVSEAAACRRSRPAPSRRPPRRGSTSASQLSGGPWPRGATVGTTGTPRSRESTSASGSLPRRLASSDRLSATTTR